MKRLFFILALSVISTCGFADSFAPQKGEISFKLYQTTSKYSIKEIRTTPFSYHKTTALQVLDLDEEKESHNYLGIGVSMTDASCWLISQMKETAKNKLLEETFGKNGLNMSIVRLNCGASDYSTALYCYDDHKDDVEMKHFSIERDKQYMIPLLKDILKKRNDMFVFSSIWSAPGWMKSSGEMCGGKLLDRYMPAFANYWAAYIKAYQKEGVNINAITVQNEPLTDQKGENPATLISPEQEMELAGKLMPEVFKKQSVGAKIWIYDHNYKYYERVIQELSDPNVRKNIGGVAWHPYSGSAEMIRKVSEKFPDVPFHLTERGMNLKDIDIQNEKWCADLVFDALNNGCQSYCAWNLLLDEDGQPVTGKFYCRGLYELNTETGTYRSTPLVTLFRQFSPFVERGARILHIDQTNENLKTIAFQNPDKTIVVVIACDNMGTNRQRIQIKYHGQYMALALPLNTWSLSTLVLGKK